MNKVLKHIFSLYLPLVSFVLLTGCIKENLEGCERCIGFEYFADGDTDVFPEYIERVSLYVFDENDQLLTAEQLGRSNPIVLEQNDLNKYQGVKLMLTGGTYRFVALGNPNTEQATEVCNLESGSMAEIVCRNPNCATSEVEGNDPLYLGSKVVEIPDDKNFATKLRLYSAHVKVSYTVEDYVPTEEDTRAHIGYFDLRVRSVKSEVTFANNDERNLASGDEVNYMPTLEYMDNGDHVANFNILRHEKESNVEFDLIKRSTGEIMRSFTLTDFLTKFDMYDISKQEVLIPIVVRFLNAEVKVTIADWSLIEVDPVFGNGYNEDDYYM